MNTKSTKSWACQPPNRLGPTGPRRHVKHTCPVKGLEVEGRSGNMASVPHRALQHFLWCVGALGQRQRLQKAPKLNPLAQWLHSSQHCTSPRAAGTPTFRNMNSKLSELMVNYDNVRWHVRLEDCGKTGWKGRLVKSREIFKEQTYCHRLVSLDFDSWLINPLKRLSSNELEHQSLRCPIWGPFKIKTRVWLVCPYDMYFCTHLFGRHLSLLVSSKERGITSGLTRAAQFLPRGVMQRVRNTLLPVGRKSYEACVDSATKDRESLGYLTPKREWGLLWSPGPSEWVRVPPSGWVLEGSPANGCRGVSAACEGGGVCVKSVSVGPKCPPCGLDWGVRTHS